MLTLDEMIGNIMLYWLSGTAASSGRLYWESCGNFAADPVTIPVGCTVFPKEILRASRRWGERKYPKRIHWSEPARGGHFAALEPLEILFAPVFERSAEAAFRADFRCGMAGLWQNRPVGLLQSNLIALCLQVPAL